MRIRSIHIAGFGVLRDQTIQLTSPLTLIYGANETGKTTLMGFIRAILFGFPNRSNFAERYEPLTGGVHGGSLTLLDDHENPILIERYVNSSASRRSSAGIVKVTFADGTVGGEERLQVLLGGLSAELFRNLFAFGLSELQELRTLQSSEISGYLYSAGLGLSGAAIMEAEKKLNNVIESLYKPRGHNQEINRMLKEMGELERALRRSKEQSSEYEQLQEVKRDSQLKLRELQTQKRSNREESNQLEQAFKARPSWIRWKHIENELMLWPEPSRLPDNAMARLDAFEEDLERNFVELRKLQLKCDELVGKHDQILIDEQTLHNQSELDHLHEQISVYEEHRRSMIELDVEVEQMKLQCDQWLDQLGLFSQLEQVIGFPINLSLRAHIRLYRDQFHEVQQHIFSRNLELERLEKQKQEHDERLQEYQQEEQASQHQFDNLYTVFGKKLKEAHVELARYTQKITRGYEQWKLVKLEQDHLQQRVEEMQRNAEWVALTRASEPKAAPVRSIRFVVMLFIVFVLSSSWLILQKEGVIATVLLAIGIGLCIIYWAISQKTVVASKAKTIQSHHRLDGQQESSAFISDQHLHVALRNLHTTQNRKSEIEQELKELIQDFLSDSQSDSSHTVSKMMSWSDTQYWLESSLDDALENVEHWLAKREGLQHQHHKVKDYEQAVHQCNKQVQEIHTSIQTSQAQKLLLETSWKHDMIQLGLHEQISPDTALESIQLIEQMQQVLRQLERQIHKKESVEQYIIAFEQRVSQLLQSPNLSDLSYALKVWKVQSQTSLRQIELKDQLGQHITEIKQELTQLQEQEERTRLRISQLLSESEVLDGEQLRSKHQQLEERKHRVEEMKRLREAIELMIGSERWNHAQLWVTSLGEDEWRQKIQELSQQADACELQENQLREQWGRLTRDIDNLEQGIDHAKQLQQVEEYKALLQRKLDEFITHAFAKSFIQKAKEQYQRERQPQVLQRASAYFQQMTQGTYVQIQALIDEQKLVAIHRFGQAVDTSLLSRGTKEQLYLCMRFSIAEEYRGKAVLPLILDDTLVNFDQPRVAQCLQVIKEMSQHHQILFFTCHAHMKDQFQQNLSDYQLIEL
jgi:uncharacterized protein YhaN